MVVQTVGTPVVRGLQLTATRATRATRVRRGLHCLVADGIAQRRGGVVVDVSDVRRDARDVRERVVDRRALGRVVSTYVRK